MRRLTALPWISPSADADRAVCEPPPSVREDSGLCGSRKDAEEGHTIKAGKAPELGSHGTENCPPTPWARARAGVAGRRGRRRRHTHEERFSCVYSPALTADGSVIQEVGTGGAVNTSLQ